MADFEKLAISLKTDDITFLDRVAEEKSVSRSAVIRWAIAHYRAAFLLPTASTCRIDRPIEEPQPTDIAN